MKCRTKNRIVEAYLITCHMNIHTPDGTVHASPGDYIILDGCERYPVKPGDFEQMYEPVEEPTEILKRRT
ncbi:MAG: hypothetical protein IKR28_06100 [Selenomonadaceae bacterium]|nr:hypothetical protein [Selenomonadaceae bacterium]